MVNVPTFASEAMIVCGAAVELVNSTTLLGEIVIGPTGTGVGEAVGTTVGLGDGEGFPAINAMLRSVLFPAGSETTATHVPGTVPGYTVNEEPVTVDSKSIEAVCP